MKRRRRLGVCFSWRHAGTRHALDCEPASLRDVTYDAAGPVDGVVFPAARPSVMLAERTSWEKVTASHDFYFQEWMVGDRLLLD